MSGGLSRLNAWLNQLPIEGELERRNARTVQVFAIGLTVIMAVSLAGLAFDRRDFSSAPVLAGSFGVFGATLFACLWAIREIRGGRPEPAYRALIFAFASVLILSLALRGLAFHEGFVARTFAVLLILPGLLLGRRALWLVFTLLLAGLALGYAHDNVWSSPIPEPTPALGPWIRLILIAALFSAIADRFGSVLRESYSLTASHERELERAVAQLKDEAARRDQAEALLVQAQKLEALGRLSGGVAHDFNNLLTAVRGFAEMARDGLDAAHPAARDLAEIELAVERGSALTQQLLAFASRQAATPRVVSLEGRLGQLLPMLRRLVKETIEIRTAFSAAPHFVRIDPTHLEQIVMNLCANANDAIAASGTLRIQTLDGAGGVVLRVSDTGEGMDAATQARAFDPFFTTKERGKGTGLGLAITHGLVHQAGGTIRIESAPGHGTTFVIELPMATDLPSADEPGRRASATHAAATVLVVEDNVQIRHIFERHLQRKGYRVIAAADPDEARTLLRQPAQHIDLLLTDIVMPHGNGFDLAREASGERPGLRVLYMSGYPDDVIAQLGGVDPGIELLRKPFSLDLLTDRIRRVLDASR